LGNQASVCNPIKFKTNKKIELGVEKMRTTQSAVTKKPRAEFKHSPLALAIVTAMTMHAPAQAESFPAQINLSDLDGDNGYVISGVGRAFYGGGTVSSAGDINGDGVTDLIIGNDYANAYTLDPVLNDYDGGFFYDADYAGAAYILFGGDDVGSTGTADLTTELDGENGFLISGTVEDGMLGRSVSAVGDINGDGTDDFIVGDPVIDTSYVVFGGADVSNGVLSVPLIDGTNGFRIEGSFNRDYAGASVSGVGDFNGDGVPDLLIGAPYGGDTFAEGESYVVFGGADVGASGSVELTSLDGSNGFVLNGFDTRDRGGYSVSAAGDVNGDGVPDIIIGALGGDASGIDEAGESYIVFGGAGVGSSGSLDLSSLDGTDGFVINGLADGDYSGTSVSAAGDVNSDGVADVIIGAETADANGNVSAGQSYVVFGRNGIGNGGSLNLSALDGANGFIINGLNAGDNLGTSVSAAGDLNGDGTSDLIVGAPEAGTGGESYIVFGGAGVGASGEFELASLNGSNGFVVSGNTVDTSGFSVSAAGDVNGDGVDDVIGGTFAQSVGVIGNFEAVNAFVIFGIDTSVSSTDPVITSPTSGDDVIQGTEGDDIIRALGGNDTICGLGGDDLINAGGGDDWVDAGSGNDTVFGLFGADILRGRSGRDRIFGGNGEDLINGDGGADRLDGGLGADLIFGGGGADEVFGRSGNDSLFGGGGNDSVLGGNGADFINGGAGADVLNGDNGNDSCVVDSADVSVDNCA